MPNYLRATYYLLTMMRHVHWPRDKLIEYQNNKLKEIIRYACENVPFYHDIFKRFEIKPSEIRAVNDLRKLPIIEKDDVKSNITRMISKEFDISRLKRVVTSGSTGQPLTVYLNGKENEYRKAKHLRANIAVGQKARDRWVVITGPQHFGETTGLQRLLGAYVPTPVSVFDDEAAKVATIQQLKPDILDGYSSSLFLLAKEMQKRGIYTIKPEFIIGGAELIERSQKQFIEKTFDAVFYDQYACSELERLAWQCKERVGYHIDADSVIIQFVDENGEEVALGETGEIVCTSLFNRAMPLIRYAVGDIGNASEECCPCGRTFPLMKLVEGRKDSLIVLPDGRVITPHVFCLNMENLKFFDYIDHYRIIQKEVGLIEFRLKMNTDIVDSEAVKDELIAHFSNTLNIRTNEVEFNVVFVEEIPLDKSGKLTTVVSELEKRK